MMALITRGMPTQGENEGNQHILLFLHLFQMNCLPGSWKKKLDCVMTSRILSIGNRKKTMTQKQYLVTVIAYNEAFGCKPVIKRNRD